MDLLLLAPYALLAVLLVPPLVTTRRRAWPPARLALYVLACGLTAVWVAASAQQADELPGGSGGDGAWGWLAAAAATAALSVAPRRYTRQGG